MYDTYLLCKFQLKIIFGGECLNRPGPGFEEIFNGTFSVPRVDRGFTLPFPVKNCNCRRFFFLKSTILKILFN